MCEAHNACIFRGPQGPPPRTGALAANPHPLSPGRGGSINHVWQLTYGSTQSVVIIRYLSDQKCQPNQRRKGQGGSEPLGTTLEWLQRGSTYTRHIVKVKTKSQVKGYIKVAYKKRCSTIQCVSMVTEVIDYYKNNGSPDYMCMLDASKAFDRVN